MPGPKKRLNTHHTPTFFKIQVYLGTEHAPAGAKKRGPGQQVLFVRGISHSESTQTAMGACF